MSVTIEDRRANSKPVNGKDIPNGTYFMGQRDFETTPRLYLRAYDGTHALEEPESEFDLDTDFYNYQPVEIEITIKGNL